LKVNFLNDDSKNFNQETDGLKEYSKKEFGKKGSKEEDLTFDDTSVQEKKIEEIKEEPVFLSEKKRKLSEKSDYKNSSSDDVFKKSSKTKIVVWVIVLGILSAASYYSYELYLKDNFFAEKTQKTEPISIVDSTKIAKEKIVNISKENQNSINKSFALINTTLKLIKNLPKNVNLRHVFLQDNVIKLEIIASDRSRLAKFSKELSSDLSFSAVLEETKAFNGEELSAVFSVKAKSEETKKVNKILNKTEIDNKLKTASTRYSLSNVSQFYIDSESIFSYTANSDFNKLKNFIDEINSSFDNVIFKNLSLLSQGKSSYLIKFNIQILK
jgi:hypothetical protein